MQKIRNPKSGDAGGIPHAPGVAVVGTEVAHPETGDKVTVVIPADHDGSRIKVEFPDGKTTYIDGWNPADRVNERTLVPCGKCGARQPLVSEVFVCSACGAKNTIALKISSDAGSGDDQAEES